MAARRVVDRFGDPGSAPGAAGGEAGAGGGADEWDDFTNASPWEELQRDVEQVLLAWGLVEQRGCDMRRRTGGESCPESSGGGAGARVMACLGRPLRAQWMVFMVERYAGSQWR